MPTIHVKPDDLRLVAQTMEVKALQMAEQVEVLRIACAYLEIAWQGGQAEPFLMEIKALVRQLSIKAEELDALGLALFRQADRWEECDQRWKTILQTL